jgi:hypothetical protein
MIPDSSRLGDLSAASFPARFVEDRPPQEASSSRWPSRDRATRTSETEGDGKAINRAAAIAIKLAHGKSYDAIKLILDLRKTPRQNMML